NRNQQRGRWRRRVVWTLLAVASVAGAVPTVILLGLRLPSVRQDIVARISRSLERNAGVGVRARGFTLAALRGGPAMQGLEVAALSDAATPFLTASRVRAAVDLRALLGGTVVVRDLRIEEPHAVLDAPLPTATEKEERGEAGFEVGAFEIAGGLIETHRV